MRFLGFLICLLFVTSPSGAEVSSSSQSERGMFSLTAGAGLANMRILNTDSSFSGYDLGVYSIDMDFRVLKFGEGELRLAANYLFGDGDSHFSSSDEAEYTEVNFGAKMYAASWLYLGTCIGTGSMDLANGSSDVKLSFPMYKFNGGVEFAVLDSLFLGVDIAYRNGYIKQSDNSELTQNSYIEGMSYLFRVIWAPPFTTTIFSTK